MPATFTIPLVTVIPGQVLTASLWNNEYNNLYTNLTPAGLDDYSTNDAEMQTQTDPYPAAATSRPTSLQGEIERLRYQLAAILGETYWYIDPDATIASLHSRVTALEGALTAPAGTKMVFYQAAAPTGWTAEAINDKFLRVVTAGGTGGTTGGSGLAPSSTITLAHTHTVASHTHTGPSHTHSTPNHSHDLDTVSVNLNVASPTHTDYMDEGGSGEIRSIASTAGGFSENVLLANTTSGGGGTTGAGGTGDTGAASPSTDSQLSNTAFQYADIIVASKN